MVVKCERVLSQISDYFDDHLDPALRRAMEEHFTQCRHCQAVLDGMGNVADLYGDEKMFTLPELPPSDSTCRTISGVGYRNGEGQEPA